MGKVDGAPFRLCAIVSRLRGQVNLWANLSSAKLSSTVLSMNEVRWLQPDELRTMRVFSRTAAGVMSRIDADLESAFGLPRSYFDLLWRLRRAPDSSMRLTELARQTASKPSRITHAISALEQRGFVVRRPVEGDRRGAAAQLTDVGLAFVESAAPTYADSARRWLLDRLDNADRDLLVGILEQVLQAMDPEALSGPTSDGRAPELEPSFP